MDFPPITTISRPRPDSLVLILDVQPELRCFKGHFEMAPILAGVVQIDWMMHLAGEHLGKTFVFRGMHSIKFLKLVHPPLLLTLTIDYSATSGLLKFRYSDELATYSSGAVRVDAQEPRP